MFDSYIASRSINNKLSKHFLLLAILIFSRLTTLTFNEVNIR